MAEIPEQSCRSTKRQRLERLLPRGYIDILCCWLCMLLVPCSADYQPEKMFLNSLANCGHGDSKPPWHKVDRYSLYSIKDDVSPHSQTGTFLKNCNIVFRSTSRDGRLCLFQRNLDFQNNNVQLRLYDGHMGVDDKTKADKVVSMDQDLLSVEWCSSGRFLTIEMAARATDASVKDVVIDLLIYHISSIHRRAYLDTSPSCGSQIELEHSQVNVTNQDTSLGSNDVYWKCSLDFVYSGQEANRSLCMVFQPASPHCIFNYTLSVYEYVSVGGRLRKMLSHDGDCQRHLPERWCSNGTKISLELKRNNGRIFEKDILFHAFVLDHHGGPETLPLLFPEPESSTAVQFTPIIITCIIVSSLLFVVIVVFTVIVWRRRQTKRPPPPRQNGESSAHMLPGKETRSRDNDYTDRTHPENV